MKKDQRFAETIGVTRLKMVNAILSAVFVFGAVYIGRNNPVLAGILAVVPVKILTTVIATEASKPVIASMLVGQIAVAVGLFVLWVSV
jgi:hypothetical protein